MDPPAEVNPARGRYALMIVALAPVIPQLLGSAFNIWYNAAVIEQMLTLPALKQRFFATIIIYNTLVFPIGIWLWVKRIRYFAPTFRHLCRGSIIDPKSLTQARRRLIHLPWFAAAICGGAWFLCIPVFLGSLMQVELSLDTRLLWHLPVSFCISGFIAITHSIFLVELATHWGLFPIFFRGVRADLPLFRWVRPANRSLGLCRYAEGPRVAKGAGATAERAHGGGVRLSAIAARVPGAS